MAPSLANIRGINPSRYEITSTLHEDQSTLVCRALNVQSREPVILKCFRPEAAKEGLARFRREYEILCDAAGIPGIVRVYGLEEFDGGLVMVLEDIGGTSLDELVPTTAFPVDEFLNLAIALAATLGELHQLRIVHQAICPAHIVLNREDGEFCLVGFGSAVEQPELNIAFQPSSTLFKPSLAYISPEQTGRMNRVVDHRADFYSLGVMSYQLLTGKLPFVAEDDLGMIHCHIAATPVPPHEVNPQVPEMLSRIVIKLMEKMAEDRYQSGWGLRADLCRCRRELQKQGSIPEFELGQQDISDRLRAPQKLYGRALEIERLLQAFERVQGGERVLLLVAGYSGVGKTSLVHAIHRPILEAGGYFLEGKFDQLQRNVPYFAWIQVFAGLMHSFLTESEAQLEERRKRILQAVGHLGRVLTEVIPTLELIVGPQPEVPALEAAEAQNRLVYVFLKLIQALASAEHPLTVFLDNLQWIDAASLDLLQALVSSPAVSHLLVIGAYRDNEVDSDHPLTRRLESIGQSGASVTKIALEPLCREDLGRLLADSLRCEPDGIDSLARLVHKKTAGNCFFAIQFISALAVEGLLAFDQKEARWSWDLGRIQAKGYTENVVELIAAKLSSLPAETQGALQELACLGSAEVATLCAVYSASEAQVYERLLEAVRQEAVVRVAGAYTFAHNRIQEAAYSLIPEGMRAEAHLRIGRLLAAHIPPDKRQEAIFSIVNQLNRGAALIATRDEREQLAELNLMAGQRAKASAAYASGLSYFAAGAALLAEDAWERRPELAFSLELNRAECELLTAKITDAEKHFSALSGRATDLAGKRAAACLGLALYQALGLPGRAVEIGLEYLREVGIAWPPHPTDEAVREEYENLMRRIGRRGSEALNDLPLLRDRGLLATMEVLGQLQAASYFTDMNLWSLVLLRMSSVSIEHGNSGLSSVAYIYLNMILGLCFGDYETGYRLARISLDLVEKRGLDQFKARVYLSYVQLIIPWTQHLRAGDAMQNRGLDAAVQTGDLIWAIFGQDMINKRLLAAGEPLENLQRKVEDGLAFSQRVNIGIDVWTPDLRLIKTLRGLTPVFGSFSGADFDEASFEQLMEGPAFLKVVVCWYWLRRLQAYVYANRYEEALAAAERAKPLLPRIASMMDEAEYHFFAALARAEAVGSAPPAERDHHLGALARHLEQLQAWAKNCPENFETRAALVGAELARVEGRELDAERFYEQAIRTARAHGFVQNEALAYELAARFYRARGLNEFAQLYARNARHGYLRWGAEGKVRQLDELYPDLRQEQTMPTSTSTIAAPVEQLDLATVIAVSQAISGEIVLEKLLDTVMRKAIEHAGAQRALLILPCGDDLRIGTQALTDGNTINIDLRDRVISTAELPESIVRYAARTQEIVILDDASARNPFSTDEYIRRHQVRSILCLPLVKQGNLVALLYLENNLAASAFTPARIAVLRMLASEAAISLENTRLYRDLAEREAKIRRLVDANIVGIFMWDSEGRIFEANDEFLRIVGYAHEDVASGRMTWMDLTPPEWLERDQREWVPKIKRTSTLPPYEKEYFRKDGSRVPVLIGAAAFDETVQQGVAFVLDITERKRAEGRIKYLADIVESTNDAVIGKTMEGKIVSWNRGAEDVYGYTAEEAVGQPVSMLIPAACRAEFDDIMARLRGGETLGRIDTQRMRKDGQIIDVSVTICPIQDAAGRLVGVSTIARDITDRKRAEEALARSEKLFRAIAETVPMIIILWTGFDKTNAYFNPAIYRLTGYSPEELPNVAAWWLLAYPDPVYRKSIADEWQSRIARAIATRGSIEPMESEVTCKDGSKKYVSWGFVSTGEQNISFGIDLTERKRAEEALASSEKMFRVITETSPLALILTSEIGERKRMEYMNPTITRLFGYSLEEVGSLAAWWPRAYPDPEYRKSVWDEWQIRTERAIATRGSIEPMESEVTCKDGSKKYISWGFVSTGEQNICFGIDLTDRKRAEETLRRLNRELHAISDCNEVLIHATDEQDLLNEICRIVCEEAGYRMAWVGYAENDDAKTVRPVAWAGSEGGYLGSAHVVWEDTERGRGPTGVAIRSGKTAYGQNFATDPNLVPWREMAAECGYRSAISLPLQDESGTVFGAFTLFSPESNAFTPEEIRLLEELAGDMAFGIRALRARIERDRAYDEIRKLNSELEVRVRERTVQLEAANKEMEAFSYSVSHDLRAPLRHIASFSRILMEEHCRELSAEAQGLLARIEKSTLRMGSLIDGLLGLARLGRREISFRIVALDGVVKDVIEELSPEWSGRQVEWKIGPLPTVKGEPVLLRQVFQNLIANALKFTRDRSPVIIEIGEIPQEGTHLMFVRDNGVGFDMKYVDRLFGVFQRLHSAETFAGTGIGLATVQRIVQRHGGKIWAEAEVDKGATFYFTCS